MNDEYVSQWFLYLPNDESGNDFLNQLKQVMNTDRYRLRTRGRMPDREKAVELGYFQNAMKGNQYNYLRFENSVPIEVAKCLAIYIEDKYDEKRSHVLWKRAYDAEQERDNLRGRLDVREARIDTLETQVADLQEQLHEATYEASYDDLQQEYRYDPDTDAVKAIKTACKDGACMHLKWYLDLVKKYKKLNEKHENQVTTIQHYQRIEESNNLLKAQVQTYEQECRNHIEHKMQLESTINALKNKLSLQSLSKQDASLISELKDVIQQALSRAISSQNVELDKKKVEADTLVGEIKYMSNLLKEKDDRIKKLEQLIQTAERESAGLSTLMQNDMRDLDIPIDDS